MNRVALVTTASDLAADLVILYFKRRGIPFLRINQEDFPRRFSVCWPGIAGQGEIVFPNATIAVADIGSGWFRHPIEKLAGSAEGGHPVADFVARESTGFLSGFWETTPWFWMSQPSRVAYASNKLVQLAQARRFDLRIPKTLITNSPDSAREFVRRRPCIAKAVVGGGFPDGGARSAIYTNPVASGDLTVDDAIQASPVIFQERIPNAFDLRVTVVGKHTFATKISIRDKADEADWRAVDPARLSHQRYRLPPTLEASALALTESFGLTFAALDFVVTPDGDCFFLELNPSGQWGWLEEATGDPITEAIGNVLASGLR